MHRVQHQMSYPVAPVDMLNSREMEQQRQQFQMLSEPNQHPYMLQTNFGFQNPFAHQHIQQHISPMVPEHLPQELHYGNPYIDQIPHRSYDLEESSEPTTRPRLTKEQVDFFEREFAENSKPPSTYKRALALQTSIDYNRISNWFQNRRAKAKQQRKQEEFERTQHRRGTRSNQGKAQATVHEDDDEEDEEEAREESQGTETEGNASEVTQESYSRDSIVPTFGTKELPSRPNALSSSASSPTRRAESIKDKGWASLQRALACARAASSSQSQISQQQQACFNPASLQNVPPSGLSAPAPLVGPTSMNRGRSRSPAKAGVVEPQVETTPMSEQQLQKHHWQDQPVVTTTWPSTTINASDMHFDFGFDEVEPYTLEKSTGPVSPVDISQQEEMLSSEDWENPLATPTMPAKMQHAFSQSLHSPSLVAPMYPGSRRGSLADGLTANFEDFGMACESSPLNITSSFPLPPSNEYVVGRTDLAARRKRSVPALALRSHSYGTPSTKSPTLRPGTTPSSVRTIRHSKSAGHGLRSSYAGVRKSSLPQRSPLSLNFEGNTLNRLMTQGSNGECAIRQPLMPVSASPLTSRHTQEQLASSFQAMAQGNLPMKEMLHQYPKHSPPITPFQTGFDSRTASMIPSSAHAQYASYSETPPYSAGPTTSSSCHWSDAGLTSPDMQHFAPVYCLPSYPYINIDEQPMLPHVYASDQNQEVVVGSSPDKKQAEWFNHTFEGQETVYAQIAQHTGSRRPKEYTFDNSNLHSFREKNSTQ